jgi:hypothetical protein
MFVMLRKSVIIVSVVSVASSLCIVGGLWYLRSVKPLSEDTEASPVSRASALSPALTPVSSSSIPIDTTTAPSQAAPKPSAAPASGQSGALRVTDGSGSSQDPSRDGSSSSDRSSPDVDFSVYDQYKASSSALYSDLRLGRGAMATAGKTLLVNYRGWLTSGKVFGFIPGQHTVILGWEVGLTSEVSTP